jgi:hypothetical protein
VKCMKWLNMDLVSEQWWAQKDVPTLLTQPPTPAKELLAEFWRLEKEAEKMLEGLAK